ncbi:uncharacterized protein LOC131686947 [Topomyia yanbarensis]|uniref:uncharacterized protein LOC131686947 n=2 Tax=Topomyia yanbarensis TaxID=2498891 RepID=UPI00273AA546|nr:uncharacterized protein LOC131686947 [Topomyia yanbarensis]
MATSGNNETPQTPTGGVASSCANCDRPDSADNFVQCDKCDAWWHMSCAGVSESVEGRPWSCRKCTPDNVSIRTVSSATRAARLALQLEELEAKRALEKQMLEAEKRHLSQMFQLRKAQLECEEEHTDRSRISKRQSIDQVRQWMEECAEQAEGAVRFSTNLETASLSMPQQTSQFEGNTKDSCYPGRTVMPQVGQVQSPLRHPSLPNVLQRTSLSAVNPAGQYGYSVPGAGNYKQIQLVDTGAIPKGTNVEQAVVSVTHNPAGNPLPPVVPGKPPHSKNKVKAQLCCEDNIAQLTEQFGNIQIPSALLMNQKSDAVFPKNLTRNVCIEQVQPNPSFGTVPVPQGLLNMSTFVPTPSQLAARQVMTKELPPFSGNPTDWPVFISSFMTTTLACGYSSAENLTRLQRCLKGAAYEAVQSRLVLPECVPHVLEDLHFLFGRPELLIDALLEKVRSVAAPKSEKLESLIDFGMVVRTLCDHLEAAGQREHLSNPSLLTELIGKLPAHVKMEWGAHLKNCREVNLKTFASFMSSVMTSVGRVTMTKVNKPPEKTNQRTRGSINTHAANPVAAVVPDRLCYSCRKPGHRIQDCGMFKALPMEERWRYVNTNGLCRNCLNAHGKRSCRSKGSCGIQGCEYRHHPLLHAARNNQVLNGQLQHSAGNFTHRVLEQVILFRIVPVVLRGSKATINTFAFLDEGSSLTLVEDKLANELGANGITKPLCLMWTGNVTRMESASKQISLTISAVNGNKEYEVEDARTVKELSLPKQTVSFERLVNQYRHLQGLPIASYEDATPRLLIGVNNLNLIVPLRTKEGLRYEPVAVKTRLGWCVYGGKMGEGTTHTVNCHSCGCTVTQELHNTVRDYFALEDVAAKAVTVLVSEEEKRAHRILEQTTTRIGKRFETGLLWKYDHIEFPDSYNMAISRLECLEKKLSREPKLKEIVQEQLTAYQTKGYTHLASKEELLNADLKRVWYLPLGLVTNPRKPDKVRIIWDAAAKVSGISLNTALLKGPDQLTSLPAVLLRFRQFKVGVTADIKEMFHQISIRKEDRHSQRFLWRSDPSHRPEIFLMDVATFGSTCSPASAQFVKNKNAEEFREQYPRAVEGIVENHYVDDCLESFESAEEALRVSREMRMIHDEGGFELRSWHSNSAEVLNGLGETKSAETKTIVQGGGFERVLGLLWSTEADELHFSTTMTNEIQNLVEGNQRPTKRQMLKCLMGFFDPLGLMSFFHIHGKMLLQDVWRSGIEWDDVVSDSIFERWLKWTRLFSEVSVVRIPRCYFHEATLEHYDGLQLHVFVDASEVAYSAAAYFRVVNPHGIGECALVAAKAKVAPLKPLSVPRMELQAAVLGSRLMKFVEEAHSLTIARRYLWTDSATVLSWLRADHRRYKQFVACRIGELLTTTDAGDWRWVPSKFNPADAATKWGKGPKLTTDSMWFKSPEFLCEPETSWPVQRIRSVDTEEELRPCYAHRGIILPTLIIDLDRFSKLSRAVRTIGHVHRFLGNLKRKRLSENAVNGRFSSEELKSAERSLIRMVQWQAFPDEMAITARNQQKSAEQWEPLDKSSRIYQLSPIVDDYGVLRIGGRIGKAPNIDLDAKFPVILPRNHRFTTLLVDDYHRKFRHGNHETVTNEIRQKYYVPRLRVAVKQQATACQWCKINKVKPQTPQMAPLPAARMAAFTKPFTYVGLDFFGPLLVKIGRSNAKRWIAVFTCLTIRAVHVEVAHSLSTDSCVKCVRRFVCRRGSPAEIHSDNGTNFQGASRLLREQMQEIQGELAATFTNTSTKWLFIPPATPHMGGSWERMVRSIKTAMETAYNNCRKLDDEALETLVVEAEAIVNTRPLTYLPLTSEESEAITPNHFLLGSSSGVRQPTVEPTDSSAALRTSWNQIQFQLDVFWKRWTREYLPTLTKRTKWFGDVKPVAEGDLVYIVDGDRRNGWERGRVQLVIKGADGKIRQAIVQTARGVVRRPVSRLAVLEVDRKTEPGGQCYGGEDVGTGSTDNVGTGSTYIVGTGSTDMVGTGSTDIHE